MKKLKAVIIGCKNMGLKHLKSLQKNLPDEIEVTSLMNSCPESSKKQAEELGLNYFNALEEITADKVDIAIIATTTSYHAYYTKNLLNKGIHCLLEKPFAVNEQECNDIIEAADKSSAKLMIGYLVIFNPFVQKLKEELHGKKIKYYEAYRSCASIGSNLDVTIVQNLMSHDISVFRYLNNCQAADIENIRTFVHETKNLQNYAKADLMLKGGCQAVFTAECTPDKTHVRTALIVDEDNNKYEIDYVPSVLRKNGAVISEGGNALAAEQQHFYDCIINDKKPQMDAGQALEIERISWLIDADIKKKFKAK